MNQMKWMNLVLIVFVILIETSAFGDDSTQYKSWVENMKANPRGPFSRIRWFCNDGSILAPKAYACKKLGGGVQHGEWTQKVTVMRDKGYFIANVFADLKPDFFISHPKPMPILKQMMIEQFLIQADDGWIFRKARYYRGALQAEDEARNGKRLLEELLNVYHQSSERFLLLREAVRLLPHYHKSAPVSHMRQIALNISKSDERFAFLRTKLHIRPDAKDAQRVRMYAQKTGKSELTDQYEQLAQKIDAVFRPSNLAPLLYKLANQLTSSVSSLRVKQGAVALEAENNPFNRFKTVARTIADLRELLSRESRPGIMLSVLDASILLEDEAYRLAVDILDDLSKISVAQSLDLMEDSSDIVYGTGLISNRQHKALKKRLGDTRIPGRNIGQFRSDLIYAARVSDWSEQNLLFHFSRTIAHFQSIEPVSGRYVHDRLHSSLLLMYSIVLERLMTDNSRQIGLTNSIWGKPVAFGINGLNTGLARGLLRAPAPGQRPDTFSKDGIFILPGTTADLPPVAGIITAGRGNILSHVQLLARNLGIPNVAVDKTLLPNIRSGVGSPIVLAVSPRGIVRIEKDSPGWDNIFARKAQIPRTILKADTNKLDLTQKGFVTLSNIRAEDSGRIAGPKAANLGELKHHFPEAVTEGVIIPFGIFRQLLDHPLNDPGLSTDPGMSMFDWMKQQYKNIEAIKANPARQKQRIEATLAHIRSWILLSDLGAQFRLSLKKKFETTLGPDGSYGVFVRSDTNVEDLPGFTGAGLNLTVPHVVGFEKILTAVKRVWASPFTPRSFGWRHAYLKNPEHVYTSVLLMKTVPVEKSGVMVTKNLATGEKGWLTIAVNEGVGGAVSGQTAEELQIHTPTGKVTLLSQATEPFKRIVLASGGMDKVAASGTDAVLSSKEISQLIAFATHLPERFPILQNDTTQESAADIEFGFLNGKLVLFQIRPLVDDAQSQQNKYLSGLDHQVDDQKEIPLNLHRIPFGREP